MRDIRMQRKYIVWLFAAISIMAPLISLVSVVVMGRINAAGVNKFPLENLRDMSDTMLGLNAFIVTILIAVITWTYSQSTQQLTTGFNVFRTALNEFENIAELDSIPESARKEWHMTTKPFITRMKGVTQEWEGFVSDPKLKQAMSGYINDFGCALENDSKQRISNTSAARQQDMLIGLTTMNIGIIGERFVTSLLGVFLSVSVVLMLSVIIRITSSMGPVSLFSTPGWLNLLLYILMPLGFLASFVFLLLAGSIWWHDVHERHEI